MEGRNTINGNIRVAAYCRVSTGSDRQDGSYELQMDHYRRYIARHPEMILVGLYGDQGRSGRSMKDRPALTQMLQDCREGKIDLILTKSVSRFARNLSECISTIRMLREHQVFVYFEKENLNTADEKNELFLNILAAIAQEESLSLSQNLRWARKKHYESGQPMEKTSYGYRHVAGELQWQIVESEARRVRLAFYLAGTGNSYRTIRDALNEMEREEKTGKVWQQTPVVHLLTNLAYIGDFLSNKDCTIADERGIRRGKNRGYVDQYYIEDHHEPLVSRELFEGVGELLRRHLLYTNRSRYSKDDLRWLEVCQELAKKEFCI